jgi:NodT family efflux transporter outer membrane factor (OMF) lipoprotein
MTRPLPAAAIVLATLLTWSCAVGPDYRRPDAGAALPASYAADPAAAGITAAAPGDSWWQALDDPVLTTLIEAALAGSPDLAAAEAEVQQERALARVAGANFYPQATLGASADRNELSRNGENLSLIPLRPPTTTFSDYRVGIDASWEIDLAGLTRRQVEAAVARSESSAEARNDARAVVAAEVADAYADHREAVARLQRAATSRDDLREIQRLTVLAAAAGDASDSDAHRAAADAAAAAAALPPLEAQRQSAIFRLTALTGRSRESVAADLAAPRDLPAAPAAVPVGLPSDLLRRRPDVRRAERELAAASADVGSAVAAQYPRFALVGNLGLDSVHSGELTSAASRYWELAPQLSLPVFAGGRLRANAQAARAGRDAALARYRSSVLAAVADTESALIRYAAATQRSAALTDAARELSQQARLEHERTLAGDASTIESLAAARAAEDAAQAETAAQAATLRDYVALAKALGGGWQEPEARANPGGSPSAAP